MADVNPAVALDFKPPTPPDVIGPITSLAQLQYLQANAQRTQAETAQYGITNQVAAGRLQSLQDFTNRIRSGQQPEEALGPSGLAAYDPAGANAILGNVQTGMTIAGNRSYAANPNDPASAASGGPGLVNTAQSAEATGLANTTARTQLYGQLGTIMANDPSPQGRAQAAQFAASIPLGRGETPQSRQQMIQQLSAAPNDQYVAAGQNFQQASMTPERYMDVSGQATGNRAAAEANFKPITTEPQQKVVLPPGLAGVVTGQAGSNTPATGAPQGGNIAAPGNRVAGLPAAQPASPPPQASQGGMGSPGLVSNRLNNPGNVRDGAFAQSQPGYLGQNNGFAIFSSPLMGQAAMEKNLASYGRQGINTPLAIASKWAPAGDGANNPQNYASFVAGRLGIGVNDKIDLTNPAQRSALAVAMSQMENGKSGTNVPAQLSAASTSPTRALPGPAPLAAMPSIPGSQPILPSSSFAPVLPTQVAASAPVVPVAPVVTGRSVGLTPPAQPTTSAPSAASAPPLAATAGGNPPATGLAADQNAPLAPPRQPGGPLVLQPGMTLAEQAAQRATGEGMAKAQVDQYTQAKEAYQNASSAQLNLNQLQKSLSSLPSSGLLTPGTGAADRLGIVKGVNTALTAAGFSPIVDPNAVGAAEESQKITGKLGFDMSRALGSREAAQIVHQAIELNPGIENTPQGARVVAASINAGLQRQKDFYQFLSQSGNKPDSDIAFNRIHPVAQYVQEAQALAKVPQSAVDLVQQHPDSPTLSAYFDKNFGAGLSRYFTGQ